MWKAGLVQENFSTPPPTNDRTMDANAMPHAAKRVCFRALNQNAVGFDGIRGRCGFPKLPEEGCHSAEFDATIHVGHHLLLS